MYSDSLRKKSPSIRYISVYHKELNVFLSKSVWCVVEEEDLWVRNEILEMEQHGSGQDLLLTDHRLEE